MYVDTGTYPTKSSFADVIILLGKVPEVTCLQHPYLYLRYIPRLQYLFGLKLKLSPAYWHLGRGRQRQSGGVDVSNTCILEARHH